MSIDENELIQRLSELLAGTNVAPQDIASNLCDVAHILEIDIPPFGHPCDCLFWKDDQLAGLDDPAHRRKDLPIDLGLVGAYFDPDQNRIFFARQQIVYLSQSSSDFTFEYKNTAETLITLVHELRHVWQHKYHKNQYFNNNTRGFGVIEDESEIDADAFSFAYVFSGKTPYSAKDLPSLISEFGLSSSLDHGKRWEKAKKLSKQYDFGKTGKISDAKLFASQSVKGFDKNIIDKARRMI